MSQQLLDRLLDKMSGLSAGLRKSIHLHVENGQAHEALAQLQEWGPPETPFVQVLQVYLLHLAGEYTQANRVIDTLIGLDISQQLVMDNCPDEATLMARWDCQAEGVSVLCTTFNHARFIEMALASFFSQVTTHPFEVIVRNDASTDGTQEILARWAVRYPRLLRVVTLPENTYRQGVAPMPAALELARYPLVAMCEGDDFWVDSGKLQQQADLLQKHPDWSAVTHNHFELDEARGRLLPGRKLKAKGYLSKQDLVNVNLVLWVHTLMLRRRHLQLPRYSHKDGILGDQVWTALLGISGPVYFLGDLLGSVARRNLASTYTPLSEADKQSRRIQTRQFLSAVLLERGERQGAERMQRWCDRARKSISLVAA